MRRGLIILGIIAFLASPGGLKPAWAFSDSQFNAIMAPLGAVGAGALAYYMYKNSPAERARGYPENLGLGEWYIAGYLGLSYLPATDWKLAANDTGNLLGPVAKNINYRPGPQAGLKFGRYLDSLPWFGIETETAFSRNNIRGGQGQISPPQSAFPPEKGADWFMIWTLQTNFLARCGFLKDKEVNFGRLQPYVGLGPGFEVVYGRFDSAKNFAVEAQAGIKYMCTEKIGLFLEYKYSYQFNVEYQDVPSNSRFGKDLTYIFDLPHHRFVLGVAYSFKNLYGN